MSAPLLARYAECIFWMARYVERAENLARLIDVNEVFSHDRRGSHNWDAIIALNSDRERYIERHGERFAPELVIHFYCLDASNPTSIFSCVRAARENARALRPLISTEMWSHLNVFYNDLNAMRAQPLALGAVSKFCSKIKQAAQAHTGITEGTFYRDQGWYFYQIGKAIERADQTTRLVDIKYHALLPSVSDIGTDIDISQWNAVLRSAAGYHAYRRVHPRGMSPKSVSSFLIFNPLFPRSVITCVRQVDSLLTELCTRYNLRSGHKAMERLDELRAALDSWTVDSVVNRGLHESLDFVQGQLIGVTDGIQRAFFGVDQDTPLAV